ncbi:hypothetical protein [Peribacillus tepidiphilus]|uniref:hypothetical protein n=1 Tax=Peribacillus tepidiphilus TaxID=2652445 RepID=UPI0035B562E1
MDEKRQERMEDLLSHLISITGNMNKKIHAFEERVDKLQESVEDLNQKFEELMEKQRIFEQGQIEMRSENEKRHHKILEKLTILQADQDYIWEKSARNE